MVSLHISCANLVSLWSMQSFFDWACDVQLTSVYLLERAL